MNLHRTTGRPDWESVPLAERSPYQRLAAATRGVLTPANLVTFLGLLTVLCGLWAILQQRYGVASALLVVGRLLDLADGWLAERTRTKSPLGELLDASVDKLVTLLTALALFAASLGPWWLLAMVLLPQAIAAVIAVIYKFSSQELHPGRVGKLSMALLWAYFIGLPLTAAAGAPAWLEIVSYAAAVVSSILGMLAVYGYARHPVGRAKSAAP